MYENGQRVYQSGTNQTEQYELSLQHSRKISLTCTLDSSSSVHGAGQVAGITPHSAESHHAPSSGGVESQTSGM